MYLYPRVRQTEWFGRAALETLSQQSCCEGHPQTQRWYKYSKRDRAIPKVEIRENVMVVGRNEEDILLKKKISLNHLKRFLTCFSWPFLSPHHCSTPQQELWKKQPNSKRCVTKICLILFRSTGEKANSLAILLIGCLSMYWQRKLVHCQA